MNVVDTGGCRLLPSSHSRDSHRVRETRDAAEAKLASHSDDGLRVGGWRAQVTVNEPRQLPAGPDCLHQGDVFALPPDA
jgi:hypothetical protein